jgi:hypothetical protein
MPISINQILRGHFRFGDEQVVKVKSDKDFLVYIWARNPETFQGGVQIHTPPSHFRGKDKGPSDGIVLDVPSQTGQNLGCIGAHAGETINFSGSSGARVSVFLTVVTEQGANVSMTTA